MEVAIFLAVFAAGLVATGLAATRREPVWHVLAFVLWLALSVGAASVESRHWVDGASSVPTLLEVRQGALLAGGVENVAAWDNSCAVLGGDNVEAAFRGYLPGAEILHAKSSGGAWRLEVDNTGEWAAVLEGAGPISVDWVQVDRPGGFEARSYGSPALSILFAVIALAFLAMGWERMGW